MTLETPGLTRKKIAVFWLPLFSTWLMMGLEGPFIAAVIARLAAAKFNLAAYGVAFSLGMLFESPIIMMLSAANALVKDRQSYLRLRRFNNALNLFITLALLFVLIPPVFFWLTRGLINLPLEVARLTRQATIILLPWPAAIGYRRFYQGVLIGNGRPRRVAVGTVVRLGSMAATALLLYQFSSLPGACVGAAALSAGVVMEALASRFMAAPILRHLLSGPAAVNHSECNLDTRTMIAFYFPLALTSVLALAVHPLLSFFLGKSRLPIASLAVLPVVSALVLIFRAAGLSFQEVAIALPGKSGGSNRSLRSFAWLLGLASSGILALITFSPAVLWWFRSVSGLSRELTRIAILPIRILTVIPALEVLLSFQRAYFVTNKKTRYITKATALEVAMVAAIMLLGVSRSNLVGVVAAALAIVSGRLCAIAYLLIAQWKIKNPPPLSDQV